MTTIALPDARPAITCPGWCTVPYEDHLADLPQLEGFVVHWSDLSQRVYLGAGTYIDGTPASDDPPQIHIDGRANDGLSLEAAEALARQILAAIEVARS